MIVRDVIAGLVLAHAAWVYAYLCGSLLQTPRLGGAEARAVPASRGEALLRVVILSASGIAITGFYSFVIGLARIVYPATFVGWLALLVAAFWVCGDPPFRRAFWTVRVATLRRAVSPGALAVYAAGLVLAVPAILPETQSDPLFGHYVLALEWAQRHEVFADYWRRFPYYAENWILIDMWAFVLRYQDEVAFVAWLTGALSLLGVYGYVVTICDRAGAFARRPQLRQFAGTMAALALALSPIFVRWLDTGMIDAPIGLFFFATVACVAMALVSDWRPWLAALVVCGAFFVGMKTSFLVFLPIFVLAAIIVARNWDAGRRVVVAAVAALVLLGSPWYVKNFVQGGDPIAPVLNLRLHGVDSKFSKEDMAGVMHDLEVDQTPVARVRIPYDILEHSETNSFRENGATLVLAFVVFPGFYVCYGLLRRRAKDWEPTDRATFILAVLLLFAVGYWLSTSHLARYTLLFYPTLSAFVATALLLAARARFRWTAAALVVVTLSAVPASANAVEYLESYWTTDYAQLASTYPGRERYLAAHIGGYTDAQYVCRVLLANPRSTRRVYLINAQDLDFTFAQHGITAIGDWFGPERYGDLNAAIDAGDAVSHLRRFRVDALLVPATAPAVPIEEQRKLFAQLERAGFHGVILPNSIYHVYFAPGISLR